MGPGSWRGSCRTCSSRLRRCRRATRGPSMTSSLDYAPTGVRRPAHQAGPRSRRSRGGNVVDLAELAGLDLDEWQQDILEDALALGSGDKWAAFEVGLVVPRQNGKG